MVPALAAIGQHVVAANGFGGLVTYVEGKSLDEQNQLLPKKVEAFAGQRVVAVCAGGWHSLALNADGVVFTWGSAEAHGWGSD